MSLISLMSIDQAKVAALLLAIFLGSSSFGVIAPLQDIVVRLAEAGLQPHLGSNQWKGQKKLEVAFLLF